MGHSSPRAALIYMHGNDARQREIADSLNKLARSELSRNSQRAKDGARRRPSGTHRARKGPGASGSREPVPATPGLTWADGWWGYLELNQGPLPYQGADAGLPVALPGQ